MATRTTSRTLTTWSEKLVAKLRDKAYRAAYVREHVKTWIAYQIRALREQRDWSQGTLAQEMDKPQSVVSRIEDPDYGKLSLQTLFDVAAAFDVALIVKFVDHRTFLQQTRKVGPEDMRVSSFDAAALKPANQRLSVTMVTLFDWAGIDAANVTRPVPKPESVVVQKGYTGIYVPFEITRVLPPAGDADRKIVLTNLSRSPRRIEHNVWH
jgi:transcriptional regulator with XRE-family HTH domain